MPSAAVQYFRLAHLSDLHLATRANRRGIHHIVGPRSGFQALRQLIFCPGHESLTGTYHDRAARALLERLRTGFRDSGEPYDGIVVTGDLATVGTSDDLAVARRFVDGGSPFNGSSAVHEWIAVVPGNHDRFRPPFNLPGSEEFEGARAFGPCWRRAESCGSTEHEKIQVFTLQKGDASLSLIAADFTLKSGEYSIYNICRHLSQGRVYDDRLSLLKTKTLDEKSAGRAVLWMTHFPPRFPRRRIDLRQEQSLVNTARELDVPYILSGHTHEAREYQVGMTVGGRLIRVLCSGSSLAYGEALRSFYEIELEITDNRVTNVISRPYWHHARRDNETKAVYHFFSATAPAQN